MGKTHGVTGNNTIAAEPKLGTWELADDDENKENPTPMIQFLCPTKTAGRSSNLSFPVLSLLDGHQTW